MSNAFAQFSEPLSWLIRGMIEYGWADISTTRIPPAGIIGGFDLSFIPKSQGKTGVLLNVPAVAGNVRCHEDETYVFEVMLINIDGSTGFAVRCADCNYLQEFAFDPENPLWSAGYIHQAISEYVPEYVRWRVGGGELTWAQRQGVPQIDGDPCSASLGTWIQQQLGLNRRFDESLWTTRELNPGASAGAAIAPIAQVGNYGARPGESNEETARQMLKRPAQALSIMVYLGILAALLAIVNIMATIAVFKLDRMFAVTTNMIFVIFAGGGGAAAWFGVREYKKIKGKVLPWVAIGYSALVPVCCFAGLPVAIWAALKWNDPRIKVIRKANG